MVCTHEFVIVHRIIKVTMNESHLPPSLIMEHVGPFMDRRTWNKLKETCRELNELSKTMNPVWPALKLCDEQPDAFQFSRDGKWIMTVNFEEPLEDEARFGGRMYANLWSVASGKQPRLSLGRIIGDRDESSQCYIHPNLKYVAVLCRSLRGASLTTVTLIAMTGQDLETIQSPFPQRMTFFPPNVVVTGISFSADGECLIIGYSGYQFDETGIIRWNLETACRRASQPDRQGPVIELLALGVGSGMSLTATGGSLFSGPGRISATHQDSVIIWSPDHPGSSARLIYSMGSLSGGGLAALNIQQVYACPTDPWTLIGICPVQNSNQDNDDDDSSSDSASNDGEQDEQLSETLSNMFLLKLPEPGTDMSLFDADKAFRMVGPLNFETINHRRDTSLAWFPCGNHFVYLVNEEYEAADSDDDADDDDDESRSVESSASSSSVVLGSSLVVTTLTNDGGYLWFERDHEGGRLLESHQNSYPYRLIQVANQMMLNQQDHPSLVRDMKIAPTGKSMLIACDNSSLLLATL